MRIFPILMALLITACDGSQEAADKPASKPAAEPIQVQKAENAETKTETQKEENQEEETWVNPYPEYCFQRVGQISQSGNRDEPRLKSGDLKNVSFLLNRKSKAPSFPTGVHVMDQARVQTIEKPPLPDRIVMGSPLIEDSALIFLFTGPDARHFRERAGGLNLKGYEVTTAVLHIDTAVDVPVDEFEVNAARRGGMIIGSQYVTGTFTLGLVPMGNSGQQYGPTTFEFGTVAEWGYFKN